MGHTNTLIDFWNRVKLESSRYCWNWVGGKNRDGYGRMKFNGKVMMIHRLSWIIHFGDIPDGMLVCHKCDNPGCVNPYHLFLGTSRDNTLDRNRKNRTAHGMNHGRSKLDDDKVQEIREMRKSGHTITELGRIFGIDHTMISRICRYKNWMSVP